MQVCALSMLLLCFKAKFKDNSPVDLKLSLTAGPSVVDVSSDSDSRFVHKRQRTSRLLTSFLSTSDVGLPHALAHA